jgi:O-antigen/teichoic acid export membrane protein
MNVNKSVAYTILTQVPTQILGIISGIFITRILGASGRGLYAIFYADVGLFNTFLGFSITTAIIYFLSAKKLTFNKILGISTIISMASIFLSIIILVIWLQLPITELLFPSNYISWEYIVWFLLFLSATQVNSVYSGFFQGVKDFRVVNIVTLINSIINIVVYGSVFIIDYFNFYKIGLLEILFLALFVLLINSLQWQMYFRKQFRYSFDFKFNWATDISPFVKYMGLGHLSNIINFFNYRLVLWILAYYLTDADVGIFALAAGLTQMLTFISNPLSQVLLPFLSSETSNSRIQTFLKFARFHFSLILILALIGAIIAPILIPFLYGAEFNASIIPFEILLGGALFSCQSRIFAGFLMADNKVKINLWATIIGFLLTISFNFILIKNFGIIGAAWSSFITYMGIFLFIYGAMLFYVKIPKYNLFLINWNDISYAREKLKRRSE